MRISKSTSSRIQLVQLLLEAVHIKLYFKPIF